MTWYVLKRLASVIPMLFGVSIFTFALITAIPGDKALAIAGYAASPDEVARVRVQYHLDKPVFVQYWYWLENALHLDFGNSRFNGESVAGQISSRLPVTISLILLAAVIALVVGALVGTVAGVYRRSLLDTVSNLFAGVALAVPAFLVAILLVLIAGVRLGWFPIQGYENFQDSPWGWLQHMFMPALALSVALGAIVYRQLRGSVAETLQARYVTAAWARGGRPRQVLRTHVLRNAAGPALTSFGVQLAHLIGGTVVVEQIFSIPGMGPYLLAAITSNDVPAIQGCILTLIVCNAVLSLLVDIAYGVIDPKLRVAT